MLKFLIDECLSVDLVEVARDRGFPESSHVAWLLPGIASTFVASPKSPVPKVNTQTWPFTRVWSVSMARTE